MGDMSTPIYYSRTQRQGSSVVERGEASVSRKRARSPAPPRPLPRRIPQRYYSEDEDDDENHNVVDGGSHGRDDDDNDREEQPPLEEEFSDDDRPILALRAPTRARPGSSSTSTAPAPAPPESPPAMAAPQEPSPPWSSSVIRNVMVENSYAFDCSICYQPLKSPIFQCTVGHVVCSPCRDKMRYATTCHVCRVRIPNGYSRCNAMEQVLDSIRFLCPHAAHGCTERLAYHERDDHAATCVHKPCHCPAEGCGFAGPIQTTLLEHFAAVHGWPCSAGSTGPTFCVRLRKGFNVVSVIDADQETTTEQQYTLVMNVEQPAPTCNAITVFCIHPTHTGTVNLGLSYYRQWWQDSDLRSVCLHSQLDVVCTDLSNGMPTPSSFSPFFVPSWSAQGGEDDDDITVTVTNCGI